MAVSREAAERRALPLEDAVVVRCCVDFAVTLLCDRDGEAYELRIEQASSLIASDGGRVTIDPENDPAGLGPILAAARTGILSASAFDDGRLEMAFGEGSALQVPTSPDFEGWELAGPGGLRFVSGPGPKLTTWLRDDQEMR